MVGHGPAEPAAGFLQLLISGDDGEARSFIDVAADAVLIGIADPMTFLGRGGDDWIIQAAIVERAYKRYAERRSEELNQLAKAIGAQVGNRVAQLFR